MDSLVRIDTGLVGIDGVLGVPENAAGVVVFAHGRGSSHLSPRNAHVARRLQAKGLATLLVDLFPPCREQEEHNRYGLPAQVERLHDAMRWLSHQPQVEALPVGLFGSSSGAAAALSLAAAMPARVRAVVSRGGRPDLAGDETLSQVRSPTLLLVGGADTEVLALNEEAYARLACCKLFVVVPGATHLFEEPGTLDVVAEQAAAWFTRHLTRAPARP